MKSSANLNKSSAKKVRKPFSASAVGKKTKSLRHLLGTLGSLQETDRAKRAYSGSLLPTWENIEAAPSVLWPKTKYCDLTGLEVSSFSLTNQLFTIFFIVSVHGPQVQALLQVTV